MATLPRVLLTLHSDDADPVRCNEQMSLLRRNLTSDDLRVCKHLEQPTVISPDTEAKCEPVSLSTLAVTFMTSGAAVALINALRATFAATRNGKVRVKVVLPSKTIEISGEHLSDSRSGQLLETLKQELQA